MTEIEVPIEKIQEDIHHQATHESGPLMTRGALLSAILAVLAAVCALFAGHFANEAMLAQIKSSDQWNYYQSKGIKASIAELKNEPEKLNRYKEEQEEIKEEADHLERESQALLHVHETLASAVTFFQVAIALTAIAVLTRRRKFLVLAATLGAVGAVFMVQGFFHHFRGSTQESIVRESESK